MRRLSLVLCLSFLFSISAPVQAASISILSLAGFPGEDPSISILQITGADAVNTQGGVASAGQQTIYYYIGDILNPVGAPTYTGPAWPLVYLSDPASLTWDPGITATISWVSHTDSVTSVTHNLLTIEGLPMYQFGPNADGTAHGAISSVWPVVSPSGAQLSSVAAPVPEPATALLLAGSLVGLLTLRRRIA